MPQAPTNLFKPEELIPIILKRRWFVIVPFCIAVIVGSYLAITLPKIYSASTLILIQPQRVPSDYVRSVISVETEARISTIAQQIKSRTNLEKVIQDFKLFNEPGDADMFMEDKVNNLRKRIGVTILDLGEKGRNRESGSAAFSISFKGTNPRKVMRVTNALTTFVIDENLKVREAQAIGTSDFLEDELNSIRLQLEAQEGRLKEYRERYMGGLPEQLETNLRILDRLQSQIISRQENLRDAKNRMALLESQIAEEQKIQQGTSIGTVSDAQDRRGFKSENQIKLERFQTQLAELESKYTARHPDIIRLKKSVAKLESELAEEQAAKPEQENGQGANDSKPVFRVTISTKMQMEEIKADMQTYAEDIAQLTRQINFYQKQVEDTPKREQELLSLNRDYDNIKEIYSSILNRRLEAEIAVNMEKKQKGEQFRILDPARMPAKPISPDMQKLFLMTLFAGLAVGGGIIFLLEYFNTSLRNAEDAEEFLDLPILSSIPAIQQPAQKKWRLVNNVLSVGGLMVSGVLLAGFAALTFKGVDQTLSLLRRFISI